MRISRARRLRRSYSPALSPGTALAVGMGMASRGAIRVRLFHDDCRRVRHAGRVPVKRCTKPQGQSEPDLVHRGLQRCTRRQSWRGNPFPGTIWDTCGEMSRRCFWWRSSWPRLCWHPGSRSRLLPAQTRLTTGTFGLTARDSSFADQHDRTARPVIRSGWGRVFAVHGS
jgi:hypothetical protein